jgi:hypothetical protein
MMYRSEGKHDALPVDVSVWRMHGSAGAAAPAGEGVSRETG